MQDGEGVVSAEYGAAEERFWMVKVLISAEHGAQLSGQLSVCQSISLSTLQAEE